jgi:hypothetical protein
LKLREEGNYFSNEKMREREPALFDLMVGQYLNDKGELGVAQKKGEASLQIKKMKNLYDVPPYVLPKLKKS